MADTTRPQWRRLYREMDGTLYATKCFTCGSAWKIYQKRCCGCEGKPEVTHWRNTRDGSYQLPATRKETR